jgi:hypothetical protein
MGNVKLWVRRQERLLLKTLKIVTEKQKPFSIPRHRKHSNSEMGAK